MTHYQLAIRQFMKSEEYKTSIAELEKHGIKKPYSENIIRRAFDAGFGYNYQSQPKKKK